MRAQLVYEKFTQDSDPIKDMGIGIKAQIKEFFKNLKATGAMWSIPNYKDTEQCIRYCIHYSAPIEFLDYFIDRDSNYDKNSVLSLFLNNNISLKYIDKIIKKGGTFEDLHDKITYNKKGGKLMPLTPTDKLIGATRRGDFDDFKKLVNAKVPVTIGMINSIFKKEWSYDRGAKRQYAEIKKWLASKSNNLEKIIHPKDHKKIDKIKELLGKKEPKQVTYPTGYKIYRLLKYIDENVVTSYKEMTKFMYELTYGKNTFNSITHLSYWKDGFPVLVDPRVYRKDMRFFLNNKGKKDLAKMEAKFKPMKIKAHI